VKGRCDTRESRGVAQSTVTGADHQRSGASLLLAMFTVAVTSVSGLRAMFVQMPMHDAPETDKGLWVS